MKRLILCSLILFVVSSNLWLTACGDAVICEAGKKELCKCLDLVGEKTCKVDGTAFGPCRCSDDEPAGEVSRESTIDQNEPAADEPATDEPAADEPAADEPAADDAGNDTGNDAGDDAGDTTEPTPEPADCAADEFEYQNKCYKTADFCEGNLNVTGFPSFTNDDQKAMAQPYVIEFDLISKKPLFCQTKDNYYYLSGAGYGLCDRDGDGWVNIEAYRAFTSTDKQLQRNARCTVKKFKHVVYHAEGQTPQIQVLKNEAFMVETFRNDGGEKLIELPLYTKDQAALPTTVGSECTADADCAGKLCYRGNCVEGRRFEPAEINTLTKVCIAGIDLNDNQLDDANERPSDTPTPSGEFGPLLSVGYFMELHHGHFQADYDNNGTKIPVYHLHERKRDTTTGKQGLALNCEEKKDGFQPDHWKKCALKDNQQCPDPQDPSKLKKGLTSCWMPDVSRLTPSLFRCSVFENNTGDYFHPDDYGFSKNYNRPRCSYKATINASDPTKRDIEFSCTADDGQRKPDPSKREVGWACISFKSYAASADYVGSCVDQKAEKVCGSKKGGETVNYVTLEKNSYGFVRASARCGTSQGVGACDKAIMVCTGGTWLACNKCNNCPQTNAGQKATCSGGTWPADSCKKEATSSTEICNGIDDDCDGSVDEASTSLTFANYYKDNDNDTYGAGSVVFKACTKANGDLCYTDSNNQVKCVAPTYKPSATVTRTYRKTSNDCNDTNKDIKPGATEVCDGIDNDCDNGIDEGITKLNFYYDDDGDGHRSSTKAFSACYLNGSNKSKVCRTDTKACISLSYGSNSSKYIEYASSQKIDCCDSNKDVYPGQTTYFSTSYTCNGKTSFDYNCDNNESPNVGVCKCSKSVKYTQRLSAQCSYEEKNKNEDWRTWISSTSSTSTLTNTSAFNSCLIDTTHAVVSSAASYSRQRKWGPDCKKTLRCSVSDINNSHTNWTPEVEISLTTKYKYLVFASSGFAPKSNKCYFNSNGSSTGCGQTPDKYVNTATSNQESTPESPVISNRNIGGCSQNEKLCYFREYKGRCRYSWQVKYSTSYKYFSNGTVSANSSVIKCR